MTHTLYLLLAAGALGAPGDGACPCNAAAAATTPPCAQVQAAPASSGGLVGWLRNLFGPHQSTAPAASASATVAAAPANKATIQPVIYAQTTTVTGPGRTTSAPPTVVVQPSPILASLKVAEKYENRVGHEKDYSWVTGHLFFIHADGGRWVVRYGLPDEIDRFGGSVVLAPGVEMRNYREGDLVCVYGDVLDEGRTSPTLGGALFRVNVISLVDRADP